MEANREEALRAKEIAEQKFCAKDVVGAKKFALKAQNLFPTLDGINQMIATLDIYLAGDVKINGESDWYAVLCISSSADEETVKKHYRKLALQLHPDKNKSIGAEGAFKLISEAWSVLSDKSRKALYDQKRNLKAFQQKASQPKRNHSVPSNGFYNFANNPPSDVRTQKASAKPNTFWTSCSKCRMQYEYLRVYLNHNLLCPNCHEAFLAIEIGVPVKASKPSVSWSATQRCRQNSSHSATANTACGHVKDGSAAQGMANTGFKHGAHVDSYNHTNFQWGAFSTTVGSASTAATSPAAAQAAYMVHHTYEKVRLEPEFAQATTKREEALQKRNRAPKRNLSDSGNFDAGMSRNTAGQDQYKKSDRPAKRSRIIGGDISSYFRGNKTEASMDRVPSADQCFNYNAGSEMGRTNGVILDSSKARAAIRLNSLSREIAQIDFQSILMEKAKVAINRKIAEWDSAAAAKAEEDKAKQKQKHKSTDNEKAAAAISVNASNQHKVDDSREDIKKIPVKKNPFDDDASDKQVIQPLTIDVPDPDFYDFDKDRSERSFEGDQVWATYDNEDGMPRFYILVNKVISSNPFKIRMSFLNSKSNSELGPLNWVASGFTKTCGDFRIGKYEISDTVNIFSHRVKWEKGTRGVVRIIPRKGDTWALYRNWSSKWNEHTADDVIYKYDMVEVLDDYTDEQGVSITPLVKVAGFKTIFHRHLDPKEVKRIPREEMFRFSHQVPSHLLTGEEAHNAPKGCRELDPAAIPLELLQVLSEVKEEEMMEATEQQQSS